MAVCDDCGAPIPVEGSKVLEATRAHYALAHPGMPRFRVTVAPGDSRIIIARDGKTFDAAHQYTKVRGQDKDPIDRVAAYLALGGDEED